MALTITTFTGNSEHITITIESDTALASAGLLNTEGSTADILSSFIATANPNEYTADIPGDYSDGVYTLDISNAADNLIISIANLLLGYQYLLAQTLQEQYDCILLQQLQGVEQLILANEGDIGRTIYVNIQNTAASCIDAPMLDYHIAKTNIWIEEGKYVIT